MRQRHLEVEWPKIVGLRNLVIHEYFGVDPEILWDVVQTHVPKLLEQVTVALAAEDAAKPPAG